MDPRPAELAVAALGALAVRALAGALEAALVAVGLTRAQALAAEPGAPPRARALAALAAAREPTAAVLRATELLAGLAAGALAAFAGACLLPAAPGAGAAAAALAALLAGLVLGAAGRGLGARHGEPVALALARPAHALGRAVAPLVRLLTAAARPLSGGAAAFALPEPPLEEVERALADYARSPSDQSTSELIHAVFEFRDKVARDVMVPRTEVIAIEVGTPVPEILRLLAEEGHSRVPVYRESLDHVVGTLHARDLVPLMEHREVIVLEDLLRPAHFVPWSKPVDRLLREMQKNHIHMAMVVDEYGGIMGVCTLEDVLEEIVGEIGDEFEVEEGKGVEAHADGTFTVRADTAVADFNRLLGAELPEDAAYETVGGFLNALAGAIPATGDRFFHRGWIFTVSEASPRRVLKVRAARVKRDPAPTRPRSG